MPVRNPQHTWVYGKAAKNYTQQMPVRNPQLCSSPTFHGFYYTKQMPVRNPEHAALSAKIYKDYTASRVVLFYGYL